MNPLTSFLQYPDGVIVHCEGAEEWEALCVLVKELGGRPIRFISEKSCARVFYNHDDYSSFKGELMMLRGEKDYYLSVKKFRECEFLEFSELCQTVPTNVFELFENMISEVTE